MNLVKILPELSELAITLLNNRKTWGDLYIEEVDGKSVGPMSGTMDFNQREEEKAKSANRYLKFKEKFEPVLAKVEELGMISETQLQKVGIQKKRPNPRASVIGNLARRASISMGVGN